MKTPFFDKNQYFSTKTPIFPLKSQFLAYKTRKAPFFPQTPPPFPHEPSPPFPPPHTTPLPQFTTLCFPIGITYLLFNIFPSKCFPSVLYTPILLIPNLIVISAFTIPVILLITSPPYLSPVDSYIFSPFLYLSSLQLQTILSTIYFYITIIF